TGYHVEWVSIVDVFIWRLLPAEVRTIKLVSSLNHRHSGDDRFKLISIENMNLHTAATYSRVLLESWPEDATAKEHAGQVHFVESPCVFLRIDVGSSYELKRSRRTSSLR